MPHIATVIHEQNAALAAGRGVPGARHINLKSMMVSNPMSVRLGSLLKPLACQSNQPTPQDWLSHNRWALQQRCYLTDLYNASTCHAAFEKLPSCLEATQMAYMDGTVARRSDSIRMCDNVYPEHVEGRDLLNVERRVRAMSSASNLFLVLTERV